MTDLVRQSVSTKAIGVTDRQTMARQTHSLTARHTIHQMHNASKWPVRNGTFACSRACLQPCLSHAEPSLCEPLTESITRQMFTQMCQSFVTDLCAVSASPDASKSAEMRLVLALDLSDTLHLCNVLKINFWRAQTCHWIQTQITSALRQTQLLLTHCTSPFMNGWQT